MNRWMESKRRAACRCLAWLGAALVASASMGCAGRHTASQMSGRAREVDRVEVLLDQGPERPFREVGRFEADARNGAVGIERLRAAAARAGVDGIYWVECSGRCFGHCTARGFVYDEPAEARE